MMGKRLLTLFVLFAVAFVFAVSGCKKGGDEKDNGEEGSEPKEEGSAMTEEEEGSGTTPEHEDDDSGEGSGTN